MENATGNIGVSYDDLLQAYRDCRSGKGGTHNAVAYEINYEANLLALRDEINARTYTPDRSIAFIVTKPVQREIFAANFRDRIVHHWIALRIEPLLEQSFIDESFNCRKDKGTLAGIKCLHEMIREKSENYTRDCWVSPSLPECFCLHSAGQENREGLPNALIIRNKSPQLSCFTAVIMMTGW